MVKAFALVCAVVGLVGCGDVVEKTVDAPVNPCPGAVCECTAATEAMDCGAHEICDESGGNRQCKCAAAYTEQSGACVFSGAPADPGFQDPSKWTVVGNGVSVMAAAPGKNQAGELSIDHTGLCEFGGVKQTFTMPPFDRADPLKVTVTITSIDPNPQPPPNNFFFLNRTTLIGIGTQWFEIAPPAVTFKTISFCLGPAAMGGPVDFQVVSAGGGQQACSSTSTGSVRVDEVKVQVAAPGECPRTPGVVNGGFQLATGWLFPVSPNSGGTGQILPNIGENGTFAAQIQQPNRCSEVTAVGSILIPSEAKVPHPAMDLYWNGTSGSRLSVELGGHHIGVLNANGQIKHSRVCIPKWAVGNITTLGLFAQRDADNACTTALNRTFILDNMSIVDEPGCGTLGDITDPSFERIANANGPMPGWGLLNGYVNDLEGASAFVINQTANANTGVGVLRTSNSNPCVSVGEAGGEFALTVPPASGAAGPAVKFSAKAAATNVNSETRATMIPAFLNVNKVVAETGAYTQNVMCLPPKLIGRVVGVRLTTGDPDGGGCAPTTYNEFGFFDDVSVGTDASCPAQ